MKLTCLALALVAVLLQEPPEYPPGWFCTPEGILTDGTVDPEHPCHCTRMIHDDLCDTPPVEDPVCNQWCHPQKCACPISCGNIDGK